MHIISGMDVVPERVASILISEATSAARGDSFLQPSLDDLYLIWYTEDM
jgi:hypothetical protein